MSEPTYPGARITKSFGMYIAHPLLFIGATFHDQIRIGRLSKSMSRETTPIGNDISALMRPPQLLLVSLSFAASAVLCIVCERDLAPYLQPVSCGLSADTKLHSSSQWHKSQMLCALILWLAAQASCRPYSCTDNKIGSRVLHV